MHRITYANDTYTNIPPGERIRLERVRRGLTQEQLANHLGISGSYISAIERGERALSNNITKKLHEFFGLSYDYIFEGKTLPDIPYPGIIYEKDIPSIYHRFDVLLGTCSEEEANTCYQMCHSFLSSSRRNRLEVYKKSSI